MVVENFDNLRWYMKTDDEKREYLIEKYYPSMLDQMDRENDIDDFFYDLVDFNMKSLRAFTEITEEFGSDEQTRVLFMKEYKKHFKKFIDRLA